MHWSGCSVEQPSLGVVGVDDECYAALYCLGLDMPFRRRPDNVRYMVSLAVIIVTLVIVFAGVAALPGRSLFSM